MDSWLRFLLGLEADETLGGGETYWELSGLPRGSWPGMAAVVLLVAGALALIFLLYFRESRLRPHQRVGLALLRFAALALVAIILLNPRMITELQFERPGKTLVLLDTSASMAQRDAHREPERSALEDVSGLDLNLRPTRTSLVFAALREKRVLQRLAEKNDVQLYAFDRGPRRLPALERETDIFPSGAETRLGDALEAVVREVGSDPIAGVVVVTDGRNNAGQDPLELIGNSARWRPVLLFTVGVGKMEDLKNFAVTALSAPDSVEIGYPFEIEGVVQLSGITKDLEAKLWRADRSGGGEILVGRRPLRATRASSETRLKFIDSLAKKGTYRYRLELPHHPGDGEISQRDNRREISVLAVEERHRVLLVAGTPTPEFKFLRNFFIRDEGIRVSCWLSTAQRGYLQDGDVVIRRLPANLSELRDYDVVLLLDPDPQTLTLELQVGLLDFVAEQGGGLAYVAGELHTPFLARDSGYQRLRALLPVVLEGAPPAAGHVYSRPWRPQLTRNGREHPICQLENDADGNAGLWRVLSPLYFTHPTRRVKPAAVSLLTGDRDSIVAAIQQAGHGESLYVGTDDLWRWRASGEKIHERFWAGVVRHLSAGKRRLRQNRFTVETDRDRYREGDQVKVVLQLFDTEKSLDDLPDSEVFIELEEPGAPAPVGAGGGRSRSTEIAVGTAQEGRRWRVRLYPVSASEGRYSGLFRATLPGHYSVVVGSSETTSFEVEAISTEWQDPSPDFQLLEDLARSGSQFLPLSRIDGLPDEIPDGSRTEIVGRRATPVWDSAFLMLLFTFILVLEWVLRKYWNLN